MMPWLISCLLVAGQAAAPIASPAAPFVYQFDEVRHKVQRWPGGDEARTVRVAKGDTAAPGDFVATGWFGQTILSVPSRGARFEVYANAQVRLAGGEPGVLLTVAHGRVKAFFEKLLDGDTGERRLAVPGALLAVRGTRYGVDVDAHGITSLVVFEGVVEVLGKTAGIEPVRIKAGEWSLISPGGQTRIQRGPAPGYSERGWSQGMRPDSGAGPGGGPGPGGQGPMAPGGSLPSGPLPGLPPGHH